MIFDGYDRETVATFRHSINREDLPLVASTIGTTPDDREAEFQLGVKCLVQGISAELEHGQICPLRCRHRSLTDPVGRRAGNPLRRPQAT